MVDFFVMKESGPKGTNPGLVRKTMRELSRQYNGFTWFRRVMCERKSLQESLGEWRKLDSDIQENWAHHAKAENKRIMDEKKQIGALGIR